MHKQSFLLALLMLMVSSYHAHAYMPCKHPDGTLDITFGNHGTVVTDFGSIFDAANGVVILPCDRIVAAGFTHEDPNGNFYYALAGYTPYGVLDTQFGPNGDGKVVSDLVNVLNTAGYPGLTPTGDSGASAIALQKNCAPCAYTTCDNSCSNPSCKIVVAGAIRATVTGIDRDFAVARYTCNGFLDTSFGYNNSGVVTTRVSPLDNAANAMAIQNDGKIIAAGFATQLDGSQQFAVVRYLCDGTLDPEFGCNGVVLIDFGTPRAQAKAVQIQKDGKIVLAGFTGLPPAYGSVDNVSEANFTLARLNPNGSLDKCFGTKGKVITSFSAIMNQSRKSDDLARALLLVEDCHNNCDSCENLKIIVVGFTEVNHIFNYDFALAGYDENGCLVNCFGNMGNGLVVTEVSPFANDGAFAALLQQDCQGKCKIIAAGLAGNGPTQEDFALVRYHLNGLIDKSFGINGIVLTDIGQDHNVINAIVQQPDGKLVVAGSAENGEDTPGDFALARYLICKQCKATACCDTPCRTTP